MSSSKLALISCHPCFSSFFQIGDCPREVFAQTLDGSCIASNALAAGLDFKICDEPFKQFFNRSPLTLFAVTYWCQGKPSCTFNPSMITVPQPRRKLFIVPAAQASTLDSARAACSAAGGVLSDLSEHQDRLSALELIADFGEEGHKKRVWIRESADHHGSRRCQYLEVQGGEQV